ncbi:hypothetical protein FQA39_LY18477 [Lamprigera yunnana]|nr:hypothetical protein FQA39_LY18477 [Lamprigera yunnana]
MKMSLSKYPRIEAISANNTKTTAQSSLPNSVMQHKQSISYVQELEENIPDNFATDDDIIQYAINLENNLHVVEEALINNERSDIPLAEENSKVAEVTIVTENVLGFEKDFSCTESTNHKLTDVNEEILSDLEWRAQDDGYSIPTQSNSDLMEDEIDVLLLTVKMWVKGIWKVIILEHKRFKEEPGKKKARG